MQFVTGTHSLHGCAENCTEITQLSHPLKRLKMILLFISCYDLAPNIRSFTGQINNINKHLIYDNKYKHLREHDNKVLKILKCLAFKLTSWLEFFYHCYCILTMPNPFNASLISLWLVLLWWDLSDYQNRHWIIGPRAPIVSYINILIMCLWGGFHKNVLH